MDRLRVYRRPTLRLDTSLWLDRLGLCRLEARLLLDLPLFLDRMLRMNSRILVLGWGACLFLSAQIVNYNSKIQLFILCTNSSFLMKGSAMCNFHPRWDRMPEIERFLPSQKLFSPIPFQREEISFRYSDAVDGCSDQRRFNHISKSQVSS